MRKIILGLAVSLDGFIEGPNGEYDWCFTDQDYGMTEFLNGVDTIFFGRKSYEMMINAEGSGITPFGRKKSYVFSNSMQGRQGDDLEIISGDIENSVKRIKSSSGKNIWLFGGTSLTSSLMNIRMVDELWLSVHPILLGHGKALFSGLHDRIHTTFVDSKSYPTGLVSLRYQVRDVVSSTS